MGREARCQARWNGGEGEVKALLETDELILRGALNARWRLAAITPSVDEDWLTLVTPDGEVTLNLGERPALSWARKILEPPTTLADKLGVGPAARVLVIGEVEDPRLQEALAIALAPSPSAAKLALAVVESPADLGAALAAHAVLPPDAPIWIVNLKGQDSPFGENLIRTSMRAAGFIDSKTASVSALLAATRYARRKA